MKHALVHLSVSSMVLMVMFCSASSHPCWQEENAMRTGGRCSPPESVQLARSGRVDIMLCVRLLLLVAVVGTDEVQYTGAVLEHEPYSSWEAGGTAILQENARIFLEHAALAKQQVRRYKRTQY
ncbi:hypothetical protein E2C01_046192 [Portunus trituberculatus]|uniref:Uncharacterized protein n=1 Tax=Portunus trituberculatus TaxID=210409 RepID=A0A5B7G409_PORTR|nr:hypothetical protein [Portunus trituberculatus]